MPDQLFVLAEEIGHKANASKRFICTVESCTGGWVAQTLTEIPGSSNWFDRGFVTYSNEAKQDMVSVLSSTLQKHGAVSENTAKEMAEGAIRHSLANLSVAITGIAGPSGGSKDKPVGTIWFAWATTTQESSGRCIEVDSSYHLLNGNRHEIRQQAVLIALQGLLERL